MGAFDFSVPQELQDLLKGAVDKIDTVAPKMINEALPIVENAVRQRAPVLKEKDKGGLKASVSMSKAKKAKKGGYVGNVTFKGSDKTGTPYMEIAVYVENGTSHAAPHPFIRPAIASCENEVTAKMRDVFNKEIGGDG